MLDVYHWEPNGASGRLLIALAEKRVEFRSHFVDPFTLEHLSAPLLELSEGGELPIVVLDGAPYIGESQVAELLEETFPDPPLMPKDPLGRWRVRVWQKYVDDGFSAAVSELAWTAFGAKGDSSVAAKLRAGLERFGTLPACEAWKSALAGYSQERLGEARTRLESAVKRIESELAGSTWLTGAAFSLADVAVFPYLQFLPRIAPDAVSDAKTPHTIAWLRAVTERPAVREALGRGRAADPFTAVIPGPEPIRWG